MPWNKSTSSAASRGGGGFDPDCLEMIRNQRDLYVKEIAIMRDVMGRLRQNLLVVLAERQQRIGYERILAAVESCR